MSDESLPLDDTQVVTAQAGAFRGTATGAVRSWRGIRYAQAPVGRLRWRDPVAAPAAAGEVDCHRVRQRVPRRNPTPQCPWAMMR